METDKGICTHIIKNDIEPLPMAELDGWIIDVLEWVQTEVDRVFFIPKELM